MFKNLVSKDQNEHMINLTFNVNPETLSQYINHLLIYEVFDNSDKLKELSNERDIQDLFDIIARLSSRETSIADKKAGRWYVIH